MHAFLSHVEEVLRVDGRMSTSIRRPKSIPHFPTTAKSFQTEGGVISLSSHLPSYLSAVLVREEDRVQKPVYYTSRALQGTEENYPLMERLAFALVTKARMLKPYFQAYTVVVLTDKPLQRVMSNPKATGRMALWAI